MIDPCEREPVDAMKDLSDQDREDITSRYAKIFQFIEKNLKICIFFNSGNFWKQS